MDENEYRKIYNSVNQMRCPYEKALLSRKHNCECLVRFNIAEREAVGCTNQDSWQRCQRLLSLIREKAQFAIKTNKSSSSLGHAKEIKIQSGGLIGLQNVLENSSQEEVININNLFNKLLAQYHDIDSIPYSIVMQAIAEFQGRKPRRKK